MTQFEVRIGINPLSWMNDDLPSLGGETPLEVALTEGRAIGYDGFELGNKFPREAPALHDLLERHSLSLIGGWYSAALLRRTADEEIDAMAADAKTAELLAIPKRSPVLRIRQVIYSTQKRPLMYVSGFYRSDRHRLVIRRFRENT